MGDGCGDFVARRARNRRRFYLLHDLIVDVREQLP